MNSNLLSFFLIKIIMFFDGLQRNQIKKINKRKIVYTDLYGFFKLRFCTLPHGIWKSERQTPLRENG